MGRVLYQSVFNVPYVAPKPLIRLVYPPRSKRFVMPDQITGVQVAIVPPPQGEEASTCTITANNVEWVQPISSLFDHELDDPAHLIGNVRLFRIIGGYGEAAVWSREFLDAINESGVKTNTGTYYIGDIKPNVDGSYEMSFGQSKTAPNITVTVAAADLLDDTHDPEMVLKNVKSFLRLAGYTDLTTPAPNGLNVGKTGPQAVALWTFRY